MWPGGRVSLVFSRLLSPPLVALPSMSEFLPCTLLSVCWLYPVCWSRPQTCDTGHTCTSSPSPSMKITPEHTLNSQPSSHLQTQQDSEDSHTSHTSHTTLITPSQGPMARSSTNVFLKHFSLVVLVVQNTALVLVMRYSRTVSVDGLKYLPTTAVVLAELVKLVTCVVMVWQGTQWDLARAAALLYTELVQKSREMMKVSIPSILYTFQNNLLYLALTYLDAATFQVCVYYYIMLYLC